MLMFLDIYLSVEQDKGCLPYLFSTKYVVHLHKIQPPLQEAQLLVQVCDNYLYCWPLFNLFKLAVIQYY